MVALLTRKTLQMVHITPRPHDHLERRNDLTARRTVPGIPKQSQIIPLAQDQIGFRVQRGANFAQSAIAASALETVFMPVQVQCFEEVAFRDGLAAAGALLRTAARVRLCGFGF